MSLVAGEQTGLNNVLRLASEVGSKLQQLNLSYCWIGGVAYQRWGEPRQTVDIDGTVFAGYGQERELAEKLSQLYTPRIDDFLTFAVVNRIVLLESDAGLGIDLSLGGLPFEERMMERASDWEVAEHGTIRTCSAEDLVVLKAFASRPQDWIDIEKVIIRQGSRLNRPQILQELQPLVDLKEEPEIITHLTQLFDGEIV